MMCSLNSSVKSLSLCCIVSSYSKGQIRVDLNLEYLESISIEIKVT